MPSPLFRLVARLELQSAQFLSGFDKAANRLRRDAAKMNRSMRDISKNTRNMQRDVRSASRDLNKLTTSVGRAGKAMGGLAGAYAAFASVRGMSNVAQQFAMIGDQVRLMESRLNILTGTDSAFGMATDTAMELGATIEDTAALFTKFAVAGETVGLTTEQINSMTRAVLQLGRVSGLSFAEVSYFSRQLAQGIGSGAFQGDELRSVRENMPLVAQAIAKHIGYAVGDLKRLGKEGKLTAEVVSEALLSLAEDGTANELFEGLPDTWEQTLNRLQTAWNLMVGEMSRTLAEEGFYETTFGPIIEAMEQAKDAIAVGGVSAGVSTIAYGGLNKPGLFTEGFTLGDALEQRLDGGGDLFQIRPESISTEGLEQLRTVLVDRVDELRTDAEAALNRWEKGPWFNDPQGISIEKLLGNTVEAEAVLFDAEELLRNVESVIAKRAELEGKDVSTDVKGGGREDEAAAQKIEKARKAYEDLQRELQNAARAREVFNESGQDALDSFLEEQQVLDKSRDFWDKYGKTLGLTRDQVTDLFRGISEESTALDDARGRAELLTQAKEKYADVEREINDLLIETNAIATGAGALREAEAARIAAEWYREWGEAAGYTLAQLQELAGQRVTAEQGRDDAAEDRKTVESAQQRISNLQERALEQRRLQEAFEQGGTKAREWEAALIEADKILADLGGSATMTREQIAELVQQGEDTFDEMSEFAAQAARNMQDTLADFLFDPFAEGLDGMLRGFVDVLRRMAAEAAAAAIFNSLGGTDGVGGLIAGVFGFGARAEGGPVSAGMPYLVGEEGPELIVPSRSGYVVPNDALGGALGGSSVVVNIDARGSDNPERLLQLLPVIKNSIKSEIYSERRRGIGG